MKKQINQVREFHEKFGLFVSNRIEIPDFPIRELRNRLIREEAREVEDELIFNFDDDLHIDNAAKELCDLLYVVYGTIISYGLQDKIEQCFDEVHRSNMSKLGKDGKPVYREDGKLLKGDNYSPADIKSILNA